MNLARSLGMFTATVSCLCFAQSADAATALGNLEVQANVDPACTVSTSPVDFGTIDPTQNTNFFATGAIQVTCTVGTAWTATANDGVNPLPAGLGNIRSMEGQNNATPSYLKYQLFTDAGLTTEWKGATNFSGVGTGSAQSSNVYGQIPSSQTAIPPDLYKDLVVVDVEY